MFSLARVLQFVNRNLVGFTTTTRFEESKMQRIIRPLLPALLIAAICSSAFAQSDPGSIDDLLGAEYPVLQDPIGPQLPEIGPQLPAELPKIGPPLTSPRQLPPPPDLNAPLIMGPDVKPQQELLPPLELPLAPPQSVIEVPRVTIDEPAPGELVLPDLTIPTPENTAADSLKGQQVLRPQLPPDNRDFALRPAPRLQSPQAMNYGSRVYSSRSRINVPIQIEFYSVNRSFGFQRSGGYRSGYRPYGGYVPNRGFGGQRPCPYSR